MYHTYNRIKHSPHYLSEYRLFGTIVSEVISIPIRSKCKILAPIDLIVKEDEIMSNLIGCLKLIR